MKADKWARVQRYITGFCALTLLVALAYSITPWINDEKNERAEMISAPSTVQEAARVDAMAKFSKEREEVRKLEVLQLSAVADDERADDSVRAEARRHLVELANHMEQEMTLEGILRMRGFEDAIVTVHTDSVNVIVRADALSQAQSAQILEVVMRETGVTGGNVKIMTASE